MQNDEDYTSQKVIDRVTLQYNEIIKVAKYGFYPNILSLLQLAQRGDIDFKQLQFANMMLPFLNVSGLQYVEAGFQDFVQTL